MFRVGHRGADRADLGALLGAVAADALGAALGLDIIYGFAFFDGLIGALALARSAAYAIICNLE
jgi:hypothetical protein